MKTKQNYKRKCSGKWSAAFSTTLGTPLVEWKSGSSVLYFLLSLKMHELMDERPKFKLKPEC